MLIIFIWFRNWKFPTMRTLLTWTHLESSRWAGGMDTGTAWRNRSEIWTLSTFHLFQMRGSEYWGWTLNSWLNLSHLMPWLECKVTLGHDDVSKHGWMLFLFIDIPTFSTTTTFAYTNPSWPRQTTTVLRLSRASPTTQTTNITSTTATTVAVAAAVRLWDEINTTNNVANSTNITRLLRLVLALPSNNKWQASNHRGQWKD